MGPDALGEGRVITGESHAVIDRKERKKKRDGRLPDSQGRGLSRTARWNQSGLIPGCLPGVTVTSSVDGARARVTAVP